jgi:hypothetical protein
VHAIYEFHPAILLIFFPFFFFLAQETCSLTCISLLIPKDHPAQGDAPDLPAGAAACRHVAQPRADGNILPQRR